MPVTSNHFRSKKCHKQELKCKLQKILNLSKYSKDLNFLLFSPSRVEALIIVSFIYWNL